MSHQTSDTVRDFIAALAPLVAQAAQSGEKVGHLLLVMGAGRYCAEAGPLEAATTLREFADMVERGEVQDPFRALL